MELRTGVVPVFAMVLFLVAIAFFYQKKIKLKIAAGFFLLLSHGCLGFILGFYSQASQNHSIFWKQKEFNKDIEQIEIFFDYWRQHAKNL